MQGCELTTRYMFRVGGRPLCFHNVMLTLPSSENGSFLVRTSFTDDEPWIDLLTFVLTENQDGFRAYVRAIDDKAWDGASWEQVREAALTANNNAAVLFIVDRPALGTGYPIQVIDLHEESRHPFRCIATELWGVDNNLNISNMDWEDFSESTDDEGVFRGFS